MSDLDDDLLALAGVSDSEDELVSRKRRVDDDEEDDEDDYDPAATLKDEEDDDGAADAAELVNPYPLQNKFRDENDRETLMAMDEVEREEILFERSQEMERYHEKKFLQDRLRQQQAMASQPTRSSKRNKTSTSGNLKSTKLSELRRQKEQKHRKAEYSDEDDDDVDELDDDDLDLGHSDYEEGQDVVWGKPRKTRTYERATYADVNKVLVGRSLLNKYCFYPEFSDVVVDCYGRINLGFDRRTRQNMYRMVKIIDVESVPDKKYKMPNFETDLYLKVSQNRKQVKAFPMSVFSDNAIMQDEYERYVKELEKNGEEIDYADDINDKQEQVNRMVNKNLTDHDINEMISKKKLNSKNIYGYDAVFLKAKLMDEIKIAKQQNNAAKVDDLSKQLKQIDSSLLNASKNKETNSMMKVNERNRKLNVENIRKAEIKSSMLRKTADPSKQAGDPFQRLKTVTRVFYQELINKENEKAEHDARANYSNLINEKKMNEQKIAESSYRTLGQMERLIRGIDFDFELKI